MQGQIARTCELRSTNLTLEDVDPWDVSHVALPLTEAASWSSIIKTARNGKMFYKKMESTY